MGTNTRTSRWSRALALAAVATTTAAYAGQLSTFEGDINSTHQTPGTGEPNAYLWGDSFDTAQTDHLPSTIGVTDGSGSMNVRDNDGGFSYGTQFLFNDPVNQPRFGDLTAGTKLLLDISTPGGNASLPSYSVGFGALNYAFGSAPFPNGLFLDSYNTAGGGNQYQFASGPAAQTALTTQTFVWDFGREMTANGVSLWQGLTEYVIIHFNSNSPAGQSADYYYDHLRVINENYAVRSTWTGTGAGNWTDGARWANGVPNAISAPAIFYGAGDGSVTLNSAVTVGSIIFDSLRTSYDGNDGIGSGVTGIGPDGSVTSETDPDMPPITNYTFSGTGSLTIDVTSGLAEMYAIVGNHNINVPVAVSDNFDIDMAAGFGPDGNAGLAGGGRFTNAARPSVTFGSAVTLAAGTTLTKRGMGTVTFTAIRGSGSLLVNGGIAVISAKGTPNSASGTSVVKSLAIAPYATLDVTNNSTIIDYDGAVGALVGNTRQQLLAGRLISSSSDATHKLGYGDNGVLNKSTFGGQTVDASSLLIKFTYTGDANLDGQVDINDLASLATAWQTAGPWTSGDFDYSGFVDINDLAGLATNWQAGVGAPLGQTFEQALAAVGLAGVTVPEPAMLGAAGLLGVGLLRRRRC